MFKMKFYCVTAFFLFAIFLHDFVGAVPKTDCPGDAEIGNCKCYQATKRIVCGAALTKFKLSQKYKLTTLSIENSQDLSKLADQTIANGNLEIDSLIIKQTAPYDSKIPSMEILQGVLSIKTKSIKIISDITYTGALDVEDLSTDLTSLVFENVANIINFDTNRFSKLERLQIINTNVENFKDINILKSSIKFLELRDTNIEKSFSFNPALCDDTQKILKIRSNAKLESFDFSTLFPLDLSTKDKCKYHIDLSDNAILDKNIFSTAVKFASLIDFYKDTNNKKLFLVMRRNQPLTCTCDFFNKVYKQNRLYIHGISCTSIKKDNAGKPIAIPLDEIQPTEINASCV